MLESPSILNELFSAHKARRERFIMALRPVVVASWRIPSERPKKPSVKKAVVAPPLAPGSDDGFDNAPTAQRVPFIEICRSVCEKYGISWIDVISARRDAGIILPRFEIMWRARKFTLLSLNQIGSRMNRDHSTVLHGIRRFQGMIDAGEV